jgi:hypothetical protein
MDLNLPTFELKLQVQNKSIILDEEPIEGRICYVEGTKNFTQEKGSHLMS